MKTSNQIKIPELSLVVLIGASSSGKSTFARKHFKASEIVSSDACRAMVCDDENSLTHNADTFDLAKTIAAKRLKNGLLTVIDATNVQNEGRKEWVRLAREFHVLPVAIVLNPDEKTLKYRNDDRTDRHLGDHVIPRQVNQLQRSLRHLKTEGFRHICILNSNEDISGIECIVREPLYNNKKSETGPFDIIGDIHGCYQELVALLLKLGYSSQTGLWTHPEGRKLVFLGDLVDRGHQSPEVLELVMANVHAGLSWCVPGNHDIKLMRWLSGKKVQLTHGLQETIDQLNSRSDEFKKQVKEFIDSLISHYVFDQGKLVVAHAGIREDMQGRGSAAVRDFCLFGETTGESDEFGLPVRYNWAADYNGNAMVVYGHTPVQEPQWLNNTIDIDTGCVFGGKLSALRYPEKEVVSVPAAKCYYDTDIPIAISNPSQVNLQHQHDDILDIEAFLGKQVIETKYGHPITIPAKNAAAAVEMISRFGVNPKWLIYLPPTMSPAETSKLPDYLEHPTEAFEYYRRAGVKQVVCEKKHMGSRAVVIVGRNKEAIRERFGITGEGIGTIYTRTGRAFFGDKNLEQALLTRLNVALEQSGFYDEFKTDWVCLDTELMPWSAKAQSLLENQYAAVGSAGKHALGATLDVLRSGLSSNPQLKGLLEKFQARNQMVLDYTESYGRYCWPVHSINDFKLAPFHILASEGKVWTDQTHHLHLEHFRNLSLFDSGLLVATPMKVVEIEDPASCADAIQWWLSLTAEGGEGMVVKPMDFLTHRKRGLVQPAIKVRGREYLRIIYGPEYTSSLNLPRLKQRNVSVKRSLALRELRLGIEGLERFVRRERMSIVHQCSQAVLALDAHRVDSRL